MCVDVCVRKKHTRHFIIYDGLFLRFLFRGKKNHY